jgi:hypothetical protein
LKRMKKLLLGVIALVVLAGGFEKRFALPLD